MGKSSKECEENRHRDLQEFQAKEAKRKRKQRAKTKSVVSSQCRAGSVPVDLDLVPLWDTLTKRQLLELAKG